MQYMAHYRIPMLSVARQPLRFHVSRRSAVAQYSHRVKRSEQPSAGWMKLSMQSVLLLFMSLLSVAPAANVDLPASASGTLHVLLLGSKPVARSYDGHAWERTQGGATLDLRCEGASCVATIAETTSYKIDSHDGPTRTGAPEQASRFLVQATFGPTRTSMKEVDATTTAGVQSWISAQMELQPSLHRVYYRERANPRAFTKTPTGGLRSACEAGSRWHSFAFTRSDEGKQLAVSSATHGGLALRIGGLLRTEVPASTNLTVGATYLFCRVEERVGGEMLVVVESESGEGCTSPSVEAVDNPAIIFEAPDLSVTHTLSDDDAGRLTALAPEMRNVSLLDRQLNCAPALQSATHVFLHVGAAYYRHDPRMQLLSNPLGAPADVSEAASAALPRVAKTFLNRASCVVLKGGLGSSSVQASVDTEACGSPGEVANVPLLQNRYNMYHTMPDCSGNNCTRDNPGDGYPIDLAVFVPEECGVPEDDAQNVKRVEDYNYDRTKRVHAQMQQGKNIACAPLPAHQRRLRACGLIVALFAPWQGR